MPNDNWIETLLLESYKNIYSENEEDQWKAVASEENVVIIMENDYRLQGRIEFNELRHAYVKRKQIARTRDSLKTSPIRNPLDGDAWTQEDETAVSMILRRPPNMSAPEIDGFGMSIGAERIKLACNMVGRQHAFHPIKDYLEACPIVDVPAAEMQGERCIVPGELEIDRIFIDYLGAPDNEAMREASRLMMLGAVTRVYEPGCKFDLCMVLEGAQDIGKSGFITELARHRWSGNLPPKKALNDTKQMIEATDGKWLVEIAELQTIKATDDVEDIKAYITKQVDTARRAYGRDAQDYARQFILIGTTNTKTYLRDSTGNRRFVPVPCTVPRIDFTLLKGNIDRLWGIALSAYRAMRTSQPSGVLQLEFSEASKGWLDIRRGLRSIVTNDDALLSMVESKLQDVDLSWYTNDDSMPYGGNPDYMILSMHQVWVAALGLEEADLAKHNNANRLATVLDRLEGFERMPWTTVHGKWNRCKIRWHKILPDEAKANLSKIEADALAKGKDDSAMLDRIEKDAAAQAASKVVSMQEFGKKERARLAAAKAAAKAKKD